MLKTKNLPKYFYSVGFISYCNYQPSIYANISGATMLASDSITKRGVSGFNFPQVIFSFGTAPEYEP